MRTLACIILASALLSACSPNVETRGYLKEPDWQQRITLNTTTREEVLDVLGSPSARSSFGPEEWYYIALKRENFGFMKPEVADQDITRISFNEDGTVKSVDTFDKSIARDDVNIASRITPTEGHQLGFVEQLLGNVGRFNSPSTTPGSGQRPRPPGGI